MNSSELAELGVLCVLNEEETLSREGIKDKLRHNFGRYWQVSDSALWPAIKRLEDDGRLHRDVDSNADGEWVLYSIAESGTDRLQELLREPIDDIFQLHRRHILMMKLGSLHHLSDDEQETQLKRLQERAERARENAQTIRREHAERVDSRGEYGYRRELLDLRISILEELIDWIGSIRR